MYKTTRTAIVLGLLAAVVVSTLLSGCGGGGGAAKEPATQVPQAGQPPTQPPTAKPAATQAPATTDLQNAFDNLVKLAPVHLKSAFVAKKGEAVQSSVSYEADVDAKGNQHLKLMSGNDGAMEIYVVDGKMYIGAGEGQFVMAGDVEKGAGFAFLAVYGGAYLLAFNELKDAKLVGSEAVGPWQANKYQVNMNLASFGAAGLAAGAQGAQWQYQGFAWIEPTKQALVKATVDWSGKAAGAAETESYHSEFLASKGTVTEIKAPEGALGLGG